MNGYHLYLIALMLIFTAFSTPDKVLADSKISYFSSSTSPSNLDSSSYQYTSSKAAGYGESFYFNSYDDKGNVIVALISITNYNPFNKGMGSFDINWIENNQTRTIHEEFDADEIYKNTNNGTRFGKFSYIKVSKEKSEIYYKGKDIQGHDVEINIHINHTETGAQSGNSYLYLDENKEDYWGLKMVAPHGKVTAVLTSEEHNSALTLNGYLDHGNATAKVPDFSDHWYRLIFLSDNWTINLHEITPKSKYGKRKPQMLYVAKNHQKIGMFSDWVYQASDFKEHHNAPYDPPTSWTLTLEHEDIKISGTVKVKNEVLAIDMLDAVNWVTRMLVKAFYSNAWQHYFLVDVEFIIEHNGLTEKVNGIAIATAEYY